MDKSIVLIILAALGFNLAATFAWADNQNDKSWQCFSSRINQLVRNDTLIASLKAYNELPPDPHALDGIWPALKDDDCAVKKLVDHPAAKLMRQWINEFSIQGEGLLIGFNGGLVAATEKTTDYWQGDEAQFLEAIQRPSGEHFIQQELYDESSNLMLIKIATPIYENDDTPPIGVMVIGLDTFIIDYLDPCKSFAK